MFDTEVSLNCSWKFLYCNSHWTMGCIQHSNGLPVGLSSFLPPTPPRAPPSQVDLYDPSHLKDGGSSIAQHCSLTSFLLPISGIASSRLGHLPFHFSYSLEPALWSFGFGSFPWFACRGGLGKPQSLSCCIWHLACFDDDVHYGAKAHDVAGDDDIYDDRGHDHNFAMCLKEEDCLKSVWDRRLYC